MKLEDQCVNLELANKLKELGIKQESLFYWIKEEYPYIWYNSNNYPMHIEKYYYSAFTVAELGGMLPSTINEYYWKYETNWYESTIQYKDDNQNIIAEEQDMYEANARAKMIIYLIEQGLINL